MTAVSRIALIGFGEVGRILADDLMAAGVSQIAVWDIQFDSPDSGPSQAVSKLNVRAARSGADAARGAEIVFSAVTAAADVAAATSAAEGIDRGAFFVDLNSASPGMKQASAKIVDGAAGRYVEAAVMTPFAPRRIASPMLLGGPHAADFLERGAALGLSARVFSEVVGRASATKMCRSVMIKGVEALLSESMLAARHYGVEDTVLDSLSDLLPIPDWHRTARYMISRTLEHGARRAEEMREAARTVEEAGVQPLMSLSIAERQDWGSQHKAALAHEDLGAMLDAIIAAMPAAANDKT